MNNEYADFYSTAPLEESWDPVEELTYLLQGAASAQATQQTAAVPPPRSGQPYGTEPVYGVAEPSYGTGASYVGEPSYGAGAAYGTEPSYGTGAAYGAEPSHGAEPSYGTDPAYGAEHGTGDPMENLARITSELPPIRHHPAGHRKVRTRKLRITWLQTVSFLIAALAAVIVAMVSVFGGLAAYAPLQHIAAKTRSGPLH